MGGRVASCLILLLLFLVMFDEASAEVGEKSKQMEAESADNGVIKMVTKMAYNSQELNSMADQQHHADDSSSSHMEHMNDPAQIFFTINDLKLGKKLPLYLAPKDPSTSPPMVAKEIADSIPFSLEQLPEILRFFSFSPGSRQARAVETTLHQCEHKRVEGETKFCSTSMESMADFARLALGLASKSSLKHLVTTHLTKPRPPYLQNYTLLQMPNAVTKFLACHLMTYPYAVHYCHYLHGGDKALQILLEGDNGNVVMAAAVCHMDTSGWTPDHVSFRVLKTKPGIVPICHIFPPNDLILIPM
ncbi:BURP domain-containing protein BNM2A-like [Momordica charantia]|uniref:BURP domain-containing protein BNM2A-like n=1 Tax=Momordica charantia TaxID=3673 RepID=A0A6J1C6L7_MOMCH|nr:BURP domain-containing protein BNM2A-like [Momordica charantia]